MDANTLNLNNGFLSTDNLPFGLITVNVNGKIIFANSEAAEIFDLPAKKLMTRNLTDFHWRSINGKEMINGYHPVSKALSSGTAEKGCLAGINTRIGSKWLNIDVVPQIDKKKKEILNANVFLNDITGKIKAGESNIETIDFSILSRLRGMTYHCKICDHLDPDYISNEAKKLTGYTVNDIIKNKGLLFNRIIHPDDRKKVLEKITGAINRGENYSVKYRIFTAKGKEKYVLNNGIVVHNGDTPVAIAGLLEDITNYKKKYRELIQAKKRAEESDRLKSAFLTTINHELRTPLNSVIGFSEIIKDTTSEPETAKTAKIIYNSGLNLLEIINDIIDLSIIDNFKITLRPEAFKLQSLFDILKTQLQELIRNAGKENLIKSVFMAAPSVLDKNIIADKDKIVQIMLNLSRNAVKFTDAGSIELGIKQNADELFSFYIKDTGIGILKKQQQVIFDIFRQADDTLTRKYEGVGIGLAISNKIAHALKGDISVKSTYGKGSIFTFTVPVKISANIEGISSDHIEHTPDLTGHNIVVADDDKSNLMLINQILRATGATVYKAKNGKEAVTIFENRKDISLVLMDIKMPVMNGLEATKIIKSNYKNIPVVALTAYSYEEKHAVNAGCEITIAKPINKKELYSILVNILG